MGSKLGNISKIAIFVVMERAIPEGDQATGEALAVYGKSIYVFLKQAMDYC